MRCDGAGLKDFKMQFACPGAYFSLCSATCMFSHPPNSRGNSAEIGGMCEEKYQVKSVQQHTLHLNMIFLPQS